MKKILSLALLLLVAWTVNAYAADEPIRIEGEDFTDINIGYGTPNAPEMSEETALFISTSNKTSDMTIEYTITVPKTGTYKMTGVTTRLSETWTSDYYFKFNDKDEYLASSGAKEIRGVRCPTLSNATYEYEYKKVNLKKGDNTLIVRLNEQDPDNSGNITTYLDYFEFTPTKSDGFKLSKIADNATQGVFEYGDNVFFTVESEGSPLVNTSYSYELTDVNENIIKKGDFVFPKGQFEANLSLGQLDEGWYRLELFNYGTRKSTGLVRRFLVLKSIYASEINNGPWASDAACTWHMGTDLKVIDRVLNVLSRTGVDWVRSRNGWSAGNSTNPVRDLDYKNGLRANSMGNPNPDFLTDYNGDLFRVYKETKNWGELYKGRKDGFEFGNEPDAHKGTGDSYSAMVKAAAIGVSDGDPEMIKLNGGVAGTPQALFIGLLFENDMLSYLDAYAYHAHSDWFGGSVPGLRDYKCWPNVEYALAYDKTIPIWLNESGIRTRVDDTGMPDEESFRAQAKHFVISSAESISMGNDKRFFFLWSHYIENGGSFGCWDKNYDPHPVIGTMAITARELKEAHYRGPMSNLPEGVTGHMINNGERDVAVVWTDGSADVTFTGTVTAIDYIGKDIEVRINKEGNSVITVDCPIFVRYEGEAPENDFYPAYERNTRELAARTFDVNERIVISSEWENQDANKVGYTGYNISENGTKATLKVYNFNDTKVEGTIKVKCDENYNVDKTELEFAIEPMSVQELEVVVSSKEDTPKKVQKRIMFYGNLSSGEELSPLVAAITKMDAGYVAKDFVPVTSLEDESRWNYGNLGGGSVKRTDLGNGEMLFEYNCPKEAGWAYPWFWLDDETRELMKNSAGLTYKIKLAEEIGDSNCIQNLYLYLVDGSSYYFEGGMPMFINFSNFSTEEWTQVTVPWNEVGLWAGSTAAVFDPGSVDRISVGLNFSSDFIPKFYVKDIGIFYEEDSDGAVERKLTISGVNDKGHYSSNEDIKISINLQGAGYTRVKALLQDDYIYDEAYEGDTVEINLGKLERGYYRFEAIGEGEYNDHKISTVFFYVD